jgi:integrase
MSELYPTAPDQPVKPPDSAAATPATPSPQNTKFEIPLPPPRGSRPKPEKPYPEFPLFAHAAGVWCKKIRGKLHYFGPWDDPDGALKKYLAEKDALHAGKKPRADPEAVTVKDVANAFLNHKKSLLDAGELSPHTWAKYRTAADLVVGHLGKNRLAADVGPDDFAALRKLMAKRWGVYRLGDMIQHVRSIFKHAHAAGLLPLAASFGPGFARPSKKVQRLHRGQQGAKLFTADEVRRMIAAATVNVRAMILLGVNCGFGNSDCGNLPLAAVDLDAAMIDFPRPKTGLARRCPLWPETVQALREVLARRSPPKHDEDAARFFLTRCGGSWAKDEYTSPLVLEMRKLLKALGINGRKRLGFYTLRHVFRTVADEAKDQPAVDFIMGHEVPHMSSVYRETISDERLKAVADHVHAWLFPPEKKPVAAKAEEEE